MPLRKTKVVLSDGKVSPLQEGEAKLPPLPDVLPAPHASWVDYSVLDEIGLRLRNAGLWDNTMADGLAALKDRISVLEKHSRFERYAEGTTPRPLKTWADCRKVLVAIAGSRWSTFSEIAAPVESCLTLAVLLYRWEESGVPVPSDVRVLMHGLICVEWPGKVGLFINGDGPSGTPPTGREG